MLWVQLMIMANSSIKTMGMDVGALTVSVTPLLQACFSVAELLTAHAAGTALAFVCSLLCADSPLAASASNLSMWRGSVVHERGSWHLAVIVSADRLSQLSFGDVA